MDETIAEETTQELDALEEKKNETENGSSEPIVEVSENSAEKQEDKASEEVIETETKSEEKNTENVSEEKSEENKIETQTEETKPAEENEKTNENKQDEENKIIEAKKEDDNASEEAISKSNKSSNSKLNEKETKSTHSSKNKLNGSDSSLSKKRASREVLNKYKSRSNINGSINNLKNSKNSLNGSKSLYNSSMMLNKNQFYHEQNQEPTDRITFENTYQLKPMKKFSSYEVKKMLDELLQKKFVTVHQEEDDDPETVYFQYETKKAQEMSKELSNEILEEVKKFEYDRYKLVVDVTIGEYTGQGVRISSRAIWDTSTDSYASSTYRYGNVFVTAIVFGCYYE
ncbi:hypothetical protein BCR36DRAFT_415356 [Piromyces finnis]|uniref:Uncharacterized protein n=1 Tax=Piromyces finnis TaxID=1754191 RepID=A0A1Y1UYW2_9FUNG|nr:hypothetical protein BCR36DRAFT_415356 [Piromyces finnis]|eukprot:ORX43756.1 hypothetical protein BCR36DRAFT_415356 [Piromyces finnis]